MKRLRVHPPKLDFRSVGFQTGLEIAVGALLTALLLRWLA